jgi:hypothetical protein
MYAHALACVFGLAFVWLGSGVAHSSGAPCAQFLKAGFPADRLLEIHGYALASDARLAAYGSAPHRALQAPSRTCSAPRRAGRCGLLALSLLTERRLRQPLWDSAGTTIDFDEVLRAGGLRRPFATLHTRHTKNTEDLSGSGSAAQVPRLWQSSAAQRKRCHHHGHIVRGRMRLRGALRCLCLTTLATKAASTTSSTNGMAHARTHARTSRDDVPSGRRRYSAWMRALPQGAVLAVVEMGAGAQAHLRAPRLTESCGQAWACRPSVP